MTGLFESIYILAAFLAGVAAVGALIFLTLASRGLSTKAFPIILFLIALGGTASVLLSGRNLSLVGTGLSITLETGSLGRWVNRAFIMMIGGLCLGVVINFFVCRMRLPTQGRTLFYGFLTFYITQSFLPSIFGTKPAFEHNQLYPLLVMVAAYLSERPTPVQFQSFSKWIFFALMVISLAAAVAMPSVTVQQHYQGWVPGLNFRLWGVASHANLLGPSALTLLLLEYLQPTRNRPLQALVVISAITVLVLSQSKTTWMAGLLCLVVLAIYRKLPEWSLLLRGGIRKAPLFVILQMIVPLLGAAAILVAALTIDMGRLAGHIMVSDIGANLETASGRSLIWATALSEWNHNWLFGYGPLIWNDEYRLQHGMFSYAFHAHNQVLQSVSMGGGVALIGMIVYVWLLVSYALRASHATKGTSVAMMLVVLIRCFSEVPLPQHAMFSLDFLIHTMLFMILVLHASPVQPAKQPISPERMPYAKATP